MSRWISSVRWATAFEEAGVMGEQLAPMSGALCDERL
jgi:hypothetical protein